MNFKPTSSGVPFSAPEMRAFEWLLTCVSEFMRLKVPLGDELLIALRAYEGPLTSVRPHVCLQISCLRKLLQALFEGADQYLLFLFRALYFFDMG
jgi:hypothetical protein